MSAARKCDALFRRYLSPRIADKILSDGQLRDSILAAADVRTRAVVLFADMRGFTAISERLTPQQVVPLLNEYFSRPDRSHLSATMAPCSTWRGIR